MSSTGPPAERTKRSVGLRSCALALVVVLGLPALTLAVALWRRPGEPVRFEVRYEGAPAPSAARVEAS